MKRLANQHLLEPGEALKGGKVELHGDAPEQILKRLNQRLKPGGGEVRVSLVQTDPRATSMCASCNTIAACP